MSDENRFDIQTEGINIERENVIVSRYTEIDLSNSSRRLVGCEGVGRLG